MPVTKVGRALDDSLFLLYFLLPLQHFSPGNSHGSTTRHTRRGIEANYLLLFASYIKTQNMVCKIIRGINSEHEESYGVYISDLYLCLLSTGVGPSETISSSCDGFNSAMYIIGMMKFVVSLPVLALILLVPALHLLDTCEQQRRREGKSEWSLQKEGEKQPNSKKQNKQHIT